jgi:hypothetical protein
MHIRKVQRDDSRSECIPRLSDRIYYHQWAMWWSWRRFGLSALGLDIPRLDANGLVTSNVADQLSRNNSDGICPGYEFIGIPYNG